MINQMGWAGKFNIKVKVDNEITEEITINNRITDVALQAIINILDNIDPDLDIKYLAIGNDSSEIGRAHI